MSEVARWLARNLPGTRLRTAPELAETALLDAESREWLSELRGPGPVHDDAVRRLHGLLLHAARFEVARRGPALPHLGGVELDAIAIEAADDALARLLGSLDDFRGARRFSTWASKFALFEAAVKLRRRSWQARDVVLRAESGGPFFFAARLTPDAEVGQGQPPEALRLALAEALTPHQREVLVALALDGVPIDVLAERLGSNRGALYATLQGARRALRARLTASGIAPDRLERISA
jgi:RNA polymerase sigma-70 factor (ECF subfamily)